MAPHAPRPTTPPSSARAYVSGGDPEVFAVNVALLLRRPLLVTGVPGIGKSSIAYHVAWTLGLGRPLRWEINSQSTLQDALYTYDAVGHLRRSQRTRTGSDTAPAVDDDAHLGDFITLGPLGTAMLPTDRPRVLLIDEMDKSGFDLPNDLLNVFEEGQFVIPELVRTRGDHQVHAFDPPPDADEWIPVRRGRVSTLHHPVVVITSNGERDFPEAFRRRCVQFEMTLPEDPAARRAHLLDIVRSQFRDEALPAKVEEDLAQYLDDPTDVALQGLFLQGKFGAPGDLVHGTLRR